MPLCDSVRALWRLARPFTCLPPVVGVLSGSAAAAGALARRKGVPVGEFLSGLDAAGLSDEPARTWGAAVTLGALAAAALNVYSNALNQVCDIEIDRQAKPDRPLVTGALTRSGALSAGLAALLAGLVWAMGARPPGMPSPDFFLCALGAALLTTAYSAPPLRLKARGLSANFAIALARGLLLKVAGWACLCPAIRPFDPEPWALGGVFFLFTLGAVTTKDFADAPFDAAAGVRSLPVAWGARAAARFTAACLCLPWLALPLLGAVGFLGAPMERLAGLALLLCSYGAWIARLLLRDPERLGQERNHPAWTHMYLLMMAAQAGLACVYVL